MATNNRPSDGYFAGMSAIIASAAAASTLVFTLFSSFLEKLVPPFDNSSQTVGFATFGTAVGLLVLSLIIQRRLSSASARTVGLVSGFLLLLAVLIFFYFRDVTRVYVYHYPPASQANAGQVLHVRGELHESGYKVVGNKTIAQAVYESGGPDYVNSNGLLWNESSRLSAIGKMEKLYISLAMLLTIALFSSGLAIWRFRKN